MVLGMAEGVVVRRPLSSKDCRERGEGTTGHGQSRASGHLATRKAYKCNFAKQYSGD